MRGRGKLQGHGGSAARAAVAALVLLGLLVSGAQAASRTPRVKRVPATTLLAQAGSRPTSTALSCSPPAANAGATTRCTATVSDTGGAGSSTPSGTVSFSSTGPGLFSNPGASCTLSGGTCDVDYRPAPNASPGSQTIGASYGGDDAHSGSAAFPGFFLTITTGATLAVSVGAPLHVLPGETLVYRISVSNSGPSDAQSVELVDVLPAPLASSTYTVDGAQGGPWPGSASIGTIPANVSRIVVITATVPPDTAPGTVIANSASASSATDTGGIRTSDPVSTRVQAVPQVSLVVGDAATQSNWAGSEVTGASAYARASVTGVAGVGAPVPTNFTTAGCSTWQVPAGISVVEVHAIGAAGSPGNPSGAAGGLGDGVSATISGLAGGSSVLDVCVDVGGGAGGAGPGPPDTAGGEGGGASAVAVGTSFASPVLVAGGGGGGSPENVGGNAGAPASGGQASPWGGMGAVGLLNGSASAAGAGGSGSQPGHEGQAGSLSTSAGPGAGGAGGAGDASQGVGFGGGGGGGGYAGGGGGGGGTLSGHSDGGGGGGSDYCAGAGVSGCTVEGGAGTHPTAGGAAGSAQVTVTYRVPSGVLTYATFSNGTCSGPAATTETSNLQAGAVPPSAATGALPAGTYSYRASYSGDDDYVSATSSCQPFAVAKATSALSTKVNDALTGETWTGAEAAGASAYQLATVTGVAGVTPTGSVTYTFYANGTCTGTPATAQTVFLDGSGRAPVSALTDPLEPGTYAYHVAYSGDGSYTAAAGGCDAFVTGQATPYASGRWPAAPPSPEPRPDVPTPPAPVTRPPPPR